MTSYVNDAMETYINRGSILRRVFTALCTHPYGLTASELVDLTYGHLEDGGPEWAFNSISVACVRFNKRAAIKQWPIRIKDTRGPGGKRQIWIVK